MKIGIVVQRYGPDITGGSEHLCRMVAERLAGRHEVTVLTTCAKDYITWANAYPEGVALLNRVTVRRFPNTRLRDLESFNQFSDRIYYNSHTMAEELEWLDRQGPVCPSLIDCLRESQEAFDRLLFFTYLYYPAYYGLGIAPEKSVLVPTAHDEPAIRLRIFQNVFEKPYGLIFNTEAEKDFANSLFTLKQQQQVAGVGVNFPERINRKAFGRKQGLLEDYFYYGGRIDAGKGCAEMIDFYLKKKRENVDLPFLMLSGHLSMELPPDPSIVYVGYLSEEEKLEAIQGALCVIIPSAMESLSLLLLESLASRTPVVVKEASKVLKDHCIKSNAGIFYNDYFEFSACLDYLMEHPKACERMGMNGQRYVHNFYTWPRVISIYEQMLCSNVGYRQNATL